MTTIKSLARIATLLLLSLVAITFLLGQEQDADTSAFLLHFIIDKTIAVGAIFAIVRLYRRWRNTDPMFIAYHKMCDNVQQSPRR